MSGGREVKRKFLQALPDDELESLYKDKNRPNSWMELRLKMNKCERLIPEAIAFLTQLTQLLLEFGIESTHVKSYSNPSHIRSSGVRTYSVTFRIKNAIENRMRFYDEIGFQLSPVKQRKLEASLRIIRRLKNHI